MFSLCVFRVFFFFFFLNSVLKHLNLCSCTSGATVCRFTIRLKAAWAVWPTFSLRKRRNWWKRERWCWNNKSPEHDIERVLKLMNVYSIMLEEDAGCSLNLTKGTSKLLFFFVVFFLFFVCHHFLFGFFSFPPPIYFSNLWRHIVLFEYTLYKIYIKLFFKPLSFKFFISRGFHVRIAYVAIWLALSHQTHQKWI